MNRKTKAILAVTAVVILLGIAGRADYTEEVIYHMPEEAYREIKDTLGEGASDYEIAKYYQRNKEEYR